MNEGRAEKCGDPRTPEKHENIHTSRFICLQELRNEADRCVELPDECIREKEAELVHEHPCRE